MRHSTFLVLPVLALLALSAACLDSDGGGSSNTGGSCNLGGGNGDAACTSCMNTNCAAQLTAAYGNAMSGGDGAGSPCADYLACNASCGCGGGSFNQSCLQGCLPKLQQGACASAATAAGVCVANQCASACGTGTGDVDLPDNVDIPTGSGGCTELSACCNAMTDVTSKTTCQMIANQGIDLACGANLGQFKAQNKCP